MSFPTNNTNSRVPVSAKSNPSGGNGRPSLNANRRSSKVRFTSAELHSAGPHYAESEAAQSNDNDNEHDAETPEVEDDHQPGLEPPKPKAKGDHDQFKEVRGRKVSTMDYFTPAPIPTNKASGRPRGNSMDSITQENGGGNGGMETPPRPASAASTRAKDNLTALPPRISRPLTQPYVPGMISPMSSVGLDLAPSTGSDNHYLTRQTMPELVSPIPVRQQQYRPPQEYQSPETNRRPQQQRMTGRPAPQLAPPVSIPSTHQRSANNGLQPPSPAQVFEVVSPRGGLYYRNAPAPRGSGIPLGPQDHYDQYRNDGPPPAPRSYSPPRADPTEFRHSSYPQDPTSSMGPAQAYHNYGPNEPVPRPNAKYPTDYRTHQQQEYLSHQVQDQYRGQGVAPPPMPAFDEYQAQRKRAEKRESSTPSYQSGSSGSRPSSDATLAEKVSEHSPERKMQHYAMDGKMNEKETDESTARHTRANSGSPQNGASSNRNPPVRRSTSELEDAADNIPPHTGVFSQLLRLGGNGNTMRHRTTSQMSGGMSRSSSVNGASNFQGMNGLGLIRTDTVTSQNFNDSMMDPDDPRVTGIKAKKVKRRQSLSDMMFRTNSTEDGESRFHKRRASVQKNVADILTRHTFILKLARALITYGAPSHRLEAQLAATANVLEVDAQFVHLPGILIASFGDYDTRTSETHFVKCGSGLMLGKLRAVHNIYREVVHDEITAGEGTKKINALLKAAPEYNIWQRLIIAAFCSGIVCPLGFGGSFIDAIAAGVLGCLLAFIQMGVASNNDMFNSIFEIAVATFISFAARGLSQSNIFCYQAVASSGVVLVLPGYIILCGSLELASKNIVSGVSRMVYAILFSLFLGFGITIGSDIFFLIDPAARRANNAAQAAASSTTTVTGTFNALNGTDWSGAFTFTNGTESAAQSSLQMGNVSCYRDPSWGWWRQDVPAIALIGLVPAFSFVLSLWNMQPWRSKQIIVMVIISCIGFICNTFANRYIFNHSDIVSAIGAFVIGILGNLYARLTGGTAFTSMSTGVLVLVPSGIAAAGGLAMTYSSNNSSDSYSQGLIIGFRMVQVAIGVTVGLLGSGLVVYSFGRKKGSALFAF